MINVSFTFPSHVRGTNVKFNVSLANGGTTPVIASSDISTQEGMVVPGVGRFSMRYGRGIEERLKKIADACRLSEEFRTVPKL